MIAPIIIKRNSGYIKNIPTATTKTAIANNPNARFSKGVSFLECALSRVFIYLKTY